MDQQLGKIEIQTFSEASAPVPKPATWEIRLPSERDLLVQQRDLLKEVIRLLKEIEYFVRTGR